MREINFDYTGASGGLSLNPTCHDAIWTFFVGAAQMCLGGTQMCLGATQMCLATNFSNVVSQRCLGATQMFFENSWVPANSSNVFFLGFHVLPEFLGTSDFAECIFFPRSMIFRNSGVS